MTKIDNDDADAEFSYSIALKELQEILNELESVQVDIDQLTKKVERANVLLQKCQTRLTSTQIQIENIIETLNED